jgi:hypothetical protein
VAAFVVDLDAAEARRARAETQEFEFSAFNGDIICANLAKGTSYRVTVAGDCDCADATYRKIQCKHVVALRLHLLNTGGVL